MIVAAASEVRVLRAMDGRVRFHLPRWSGCGPRQLEKALLRRPGVERAQASPLTRNVLLVFDARCISQEDLIDEVQGAQRIAEGFDAPQRQEPLPPVLHDSPAGNVQRAWIGVRGLDRDPCLAETIVRQLEKHEGVRAQPVPLTGHILVESGAAQFSLAEMVAEVAEYEPPPVANETRPAHPLDPAPLVHAIVRTAGSVAGLAWIAVRRLTGIGPSRGADTAAKISAILGLLRSFPVVREGFRRMLGRNAADAGFSVANIVTLAVANSPLGLIVMGLEAFVLLREVLAQRSAWRRYEEYHGIAVEIRPGSVLRLEAGERVPVAARVLEGVGTAIGRDGLPDPLRPGMKKYAGARVAGGPFTVRLDERESFVPNIPPASTPPVCAAYVRWLSPASLAYAGLMGLATRSLGQTLTALLLVNPRTALGGTEAANLDAATRVVRAGAVVVASRPDRTIGRPDLLLLDHARLLTDGLELSQMIPLSPDHDPSGLLCLAAGVSAAAGSPWGAVFACVAGTEHAEGAFDGKQATATIGGKDYGLRPVNDTTTHPEAVQRIRHGEYVLELSSGDGRRPLALFALRPRIAPGAEELVQTCRRHGVHVGIVPGGEPAAVQSISHRTGIPLTVSTDAVAIIRKAQSRGAAVAFVSDSAEAAEPLAGCDLAIGLSAGRRGFPARVDLLAPDLLAVAAIVEAGARRDTAVRDAVLCSAAANLVGSVWGWMERPGIERASIPVNIGIMTAVADGLVRLAGGKRPGVSLAYLVDPHPERWGQQDVANVLRAFRTSERGLSRAEALKRRRRGPRKARRHELISAALDQFRYPTTSILAGAASLSLVVGRSLDFAIITATIGMNVAVGIWQEQQANRAAEALTRMATATARALRDAETVVLPASELVPGDILLLESGDRVAADARLLQSQQLEVDEAALTGESLPVSKTAVNGFPESRVVLEGSDVVAGTGSAVVVAVGRQTRMGTLAAALDLDETEQSPLGIRLGRLLWRSLPLTAAASGVTVLAGLARRQPLVPQLMVGATMALASVPEGLPLLAGMGQGGVARRLARRQALVRRLAAVEALGRVDIACADKTGTMTQGRLALSLVADAETHASIPGDLPLPEDLRRVLAAAACASPHPDAAGAAAHPTDVAVVRAAEQAGLADVVRQPREREDPFGSDQAFHAAVVQAALCVKGAPEALLPRCTRLRRRREDVPLDDAARAELAAKAERFAGQGLRVLMVAEGSPDVPIEDPGDLVALGFLGIRDPLRPTVKAAIHRCREAGVRVVMITGDHPATARRIAEEAGLAIDADSILTGSELGQLDGQLDRRLEGVTVIARATPLDKLRIIESLQRQGHTVAMTGDGVNDAPALRLADVGVAMGRAGTEVARQAADVVLADDDFATLVEALVEGRGFWQNMRRALGLLLGGNLGELGLIAGASLLGFPAPLTAHQILVVNLITDALPALAVVLQRPEHRNLSHLAREGLGALDKSLRTDVTRRAALTALPSLAAYLLAAGRGSLAQANTVAFASIVGNQLAQTYQAGRFQSHLGDPVFQAVLASAGLLGATLSVPTLQRLLGLALPTPASCALIGASALSAAWLGRAGSNGAAGDSNSTTGPIV